MATFDDLKPGDRVIHILLGEGTVFVRDPHDTDPDEIVCVRYDTPVGSSRPVGKYNRVWFKTRAEFLRKRSHANHHNQ